jgi:hypothetical protein
MLEDVAMKGGDEQGGVTVGWIDLKLTSGEPVTRREISAAYLRYEALPGTGGRMTVLPDSAKAAIEKAAEAEAKGLLIKDDPGF